MTQSARRSPRTQRTAARPPRQAGPTREEEEVADLKIGHHGRWGRLGCGTLGEEFRENNMDEKQAAQPGQVQIKADEKELQGVYSNLVMIHHHAEEFTLNFVYIFPNGTQGKLLSSVIVSPGHAKRIWRALGENISRFEAAYGPIKEGPEGAPVPGANIGFVQ
jgi:hypothetical protein